MAEHVSLLLLLARGIDELVGAGVHASGELRRLAESERPTEGVGQLAALIAVFLDRAEGPALASLRVALAEERVRWEARAGDDPSAARVRDVISALLQILEPFPAEPSGEEEKTGGPLRRARGPRQRGYRPRDMV